MHGTISIDEHEGPVPAEDHPRDKTELSHVYLDDEGHIIAVFEDKSEMDVTELFNGLKQG